MQPEVVAVNTNDPHWDDMLTFRQTSIRQERPWSEVADDVSDDTYQSDSRWAHATQTRLGRLLWLTLLPVLLVVGWSSVPLMTDPLTGKLNFWFFLCFYYGLYNAVALALVTQIFRVYSLTWWPSSVNGTLANIMSWSISLAVAALAHVLGTGAERHPMAWTGLTLLTLLLPVALSLGVIQRRRRRRPKRASSEYMPLLAISTVEWRTPASYRRFLWFLGSLLLWYLALGAGEYLASAFTSTLPHTTADGFFYVYTWILTVNLLSAMATWVISARIRSWPLQYIYTLYFFMTYFIFYRNLFARLQDPSQVVLLQVGSSLWVVFIYPVRMTRLAYRVLAFILGLPQDQNSYQAYGRQLRRTVFLRMRAETATMACFLACVTLLHFGPNRQHYPYFQFNPTDDQYDYEYRLTVRASAYIWASELVAGLGVRLLCRWAFGQSVSTDAQKDFQRYPHVVPAMVLVTVHVLQNILFGLIKLEF